MFWTALENLPIDHPLKRGPWARLINLQGTLDASPPKTTTQYSHTSDSGHEIDSSEENEPQGNPIPMDEDEIADDEETLGAGLHTATEMNKPQGEG